MEYLETEKLIFWTFAVMVEYAGRIGKGGAVLFGRRIGYKFTGSTEPRRRRPFCDTIKKSHAMTYQNNQRFQLVGTTWPGGGILPSGDKPENTPPYKKE
jgi:hypothetical protein